LAHLPEFKLNEAVLENSSELKINKLAQNRLSAVILFFFFFVIQTEFRMSSLPIIDSKNLRTWMYPTNYPVREYQRDISQRALFHNTLVCLPTGLGKTLIAAVVIYNYYRWFPNGISFLMYFTIRIEVSLFHRKNHFHGSDSSVS
jgi:hypothetical protein